jgi:endonuclease/exonuclease/phosphatase family metal-dependent hydrolase
MRGRMAESASDLLTIITWNTHVGAGDVPALVDDLVAGRLSDGRPVRTFVLLLQEAMRRGPAVPRSPVRGMRGARRIAQASRQDIEAVAARLGLSLFYVPSMRNGGPAVDEDRGNAILASVPLDRFTAIELPFERQRRVALEASISVRSPDGPLVVRCATAHLTNMVGHHLWIFSEPGRTRQAEALARTLEESPLVLGGDFNTWFGSADAAYRALARRFTTIDDADRRPTFGHLRLDHFFVRLPPGWRFTFHRAERRYGSDHYPLIGVLRLPDRTDSPR